MKKIILCEGKYDSIFLSKILEKMNHSSESIKLFDAQSVPKGKKSEETRIIRNFINGKEPYSPKKILIKSECGKKHALKVFCREFTTLINRVDDIVILLDTDSIDFNQTIKWIKKDFSLKFSSVRLQVDSELIKEEDHMHCSKIKFLVNGDEKGYIHLVLIKGSLEKLCNMTPTCDEKTKTEKIGKILEEKEVTSFFPVFKV